MEKKEPRSFQVELTQSPLVKVSDTIDKARVKIFYKGENRNGGFITDEFAEMLIRTLPYTPIKGIVDSESGDFTSHGAHPSEGKIYGIVPESPNATWEKSTDVDGENREYLTADVYLFTGLYESAKHIIGKGQSMELLPSSIKGSWREVGLKEMFFYDSAAFLGLQVLGSDVEPAFEGAAFFSLQKDELSELIEKTYGGEAMEKDNKATEDKLSEFEARVAELEQEKNQLEAELETLREFKLGIERKEKEKILADFSGLVKDEVLENLKGRLDSFDNASLEKELAYEKYQLEKEQGGEKEVAEEPVEAKEEVDNKEEVEDGEDEDEDKGKTNFSFYEVDEPKVKSATEALLDKYL